MPGQLPLPLPVQKRKIGRTERQVNAAIRTAQHAGEVGPVHAGAVALARELARAVDHATVVGNPWAIAALSRELRESIASLGLDRASRGELTHGTDLGTDLAAYLASMDAAQTGDRPQP